MKTLLRYPGGKSRAVQILKEYIPNNITEICSPFFGGGSLEIYLANQGIKVNGYDIFTPLVEFWKAVIHQPLELTEEIKKLYPLEKEQFYELQKQQFNFEGLKMAAAFYVLNRCSFSGSTLSGGMSLNHPRFTTSSIQKVKDFKSSNLSVEHMSFHDSISKHNNTFLYCDPPYLIKNHLYGEKGNTHKNFDHEGLCEALKNHKGGWILSYNNNNYIKDMYKGYEFVYPSWKYGMSKDKDSKEILILNY